MSDTPIEIKVMKANASVTIEISDALYNRIRNLLLSGVPFTDLNSLQKVLATIKNSEQDPDTITYHTRTLINILALIEEAADKQNLLETKQIDRSTGKPIQNPA